MEVLKNFGVNGPLLGAQILNFLIVFYILKRLLYKPVLNMLKKRENEVKEGLKLAEEGKKTFEESSIKEREILKKASEEADKIVANAKTQALEASKQIDSEARVRAEKTLKQAHEKIELDTKEAEEKLTRNIGKIALSILEKTLPQILSKKDQEEILKKAASQIK
jgi:F-type H+-transporting ATPase subunit b